ncbi:TPA: cysteine desulfurase NifS [Candidatus Uhrbacteria bacterium]|nr:cysteine desulfurase NifS [Candidatus Uhrbacteria bacterium]HCB19578.1 cysteine desulfurase NifS [Candidatus Uhrbacteria bacterium]
MRQVRQTWFGTPQKSTRFIYLDHAAATHLDPQVRAVMEPYMQEEFGNPSSLYGQGVRAGQAVENSRKSVAKILGALPEEILFTSGGTESDNLALLGYARAHAKGGKHIITTAIEHHAVLGATKQLEKEGFEVAYLVPDTQGLITAQQVKQALRPDTILISIMYANNEIGTIEPISEIGNMVQKYRQETGKTFPVFHTDACQATGYLDLQAEKLHVDLLTLNGSKMYGPKGIGILYRRRGIKLQSLQFGGSQEHNIRPGTENVPVIVGLAKALEIAESLRAKECERLCTLRDFFIREILTSVSHTHLNGHPTTRLPNNINISFAAAEGEAMLLYLDHEGIAVSTGSACTSQSLDPSHVLMAIGSTHEEAHSSLRFTLGRSTTKKDIEDVLDILPPIIQKLRLLSPLV